MQIYNENSITKKFNLFFSEKGNVLKKETKGSNIRKVSFHYLKSDYLILTFTNLNIYMVLTIKVFFNKKFCLAFKKTLKSYILRNLSSLL